MLKRYHLKSEILNEERIIEVWFPSGVVENDRLPVLYVQDGENVFRDEDAVGGVSFQLESYLHENETSAIVVAIHQPTSSRFDYYCPWPFGEYSNALVGTERTTAALGDSYAKFVVKEVKPFIDSIYSTDPKRQAIAGCSLGGSIALYTALKFPPTFSTVYALSPAFFRNLEKFEEMIETYLDSLPTVVMDVGSEEGTKETVNGFIESIYRIEQSLIKRGATVHFELETGAAHHYSYFQKRKEKLFSFL